MLKYSNTGLRSPPPHRFNLPRYHSRDYGRVKCHFNCVCCCFCFWVLLIVVLGTLAVLLFTSFQTDVPIYKVDRLEIHGSRHSSELSVTVKTSNPNKHVGFVYGKESSVAVEYQGATIWSGNLPAFHQPRDNITTMNIVLKDETALGSTLLKALRDSKIKGNIALLVKLKAPVYVLLQDIQLGAIVVSTNCSLEVNGFIPNKKTTIVSTKCNYDVGL